jgi:AcrR family transcriptional regulator
MATETRGRILSSAEKLFVDNGFDGTSLRAITADADVNLAAVNYHFGSKEQLLEEVVRRRIAPVNAERIQRLDGLEREHGLYGISLEQYLDAFIRPAMETLHGTDRHHTVRLLGMLFDAPLPTSFFQETFADVLARFGRMASILPGLPREEFAWRFHFMIGSMFHSAAHRITERDPRLVEQDNDSLTDMLVAWAAAGFRASATLRNDSVTLSQETPS